MEDIRAEDIMIPLDSYPQVPCWLSLRQAIAEMEKTQLEVEGRKSLPRVAFVFDEQNRLMGMIRRRDILRGLGPDAMQEPIEREGERDPGIKRDLQSPDLTGRPSLDELRKRADRPVRDVMIPIRVSLSNRTPLVDIVRVLVMSDISVVPILKDNVVVGVVRSADVLYWMGKLIA